MLVVLTTCGSESLPEREILYRSCLQFLSWTCHGSVKWLLVLIFCNWLLTLSLLPFCLVLKELKQTLLIYWWLERNTLQSPSCIPGVTEREKVGNQNRRSITFSLQGYYLSCLKKCWSFCCVLKHWRLDFVKDDTSGEVLFESHPHDLQGFIYSRKWSRFSFFAYHRLAFLSCDARSVHFSEPGREEQGEQKKRGSSLLSSPVYFVRVS